MAANQLYTSLQALNLLSARVMQNYHVLHEIALELEAVLNKTDQQIEIIETSKKIPEFLANLMNHQIFQISFPLIIQHESRRRLHEEISSDVPKISKDSLMPKDVGKEEIEENKTLSVKTSTLNLKQMSTITKKSSNNDSRAMKSLSLTERRSRKNPKNNETKFEILKVDLEDEDPQILKLRQLTQMRLKFDFQYQKLNMFREKSFKDKSKYLNDLIEEQPSAGITHDYEGEQLKSIIADEKIKHYIMRAEFGPLAKKTKESVGEPDVASINLNKNYKEKGDLHKPIKAMEMPLFPAPPRDLTTLHQVKNYKLHDYRKHFGRKYSRLDQYSQSIDLNSTKNREEHKDEIFSERRHLRDSSSVVQSSKQILVQNRRMRRLALPRLNGKYKVLDRYEQF